jgi:hypothetical protein
MKKQGGFISTIIVVILALAAAKYFFNWSIFDAAETPEGQGTVVYIRRVLDIIWSYLVYPLSWIWENLLEAIRNRN